MVNIAAGETVTIEIDGKYYDVQNLYTGGSQTLTYSVTDGQITFEGGELIDDSLSNVLQITAHSGQEDNVSINGENIKFAAGDMDDYVIVKEGVYASYISGGSGNDTILNSGYMKSVDGGYGDDSIVNEGTVNYNIYGGDGADAITNAEGASVGFIYGEDGDDSIVNEGTVNNIRGGDGNDIITNAEGAVGSHIWGDAGDDSIVNNGTVYAASLGAGNDTFINNGTVNGIGAGDGADTIINNEGASVNTIYGDAGDDSIVNDGVVSGEINGQNPYGETDTSTNDNLYVGANSSVGGYGADDVQGAIDNNKITGIENIEIEGGKQMVNIASGETVTIEIDGKYYDVQNRYTGGSQTLTYSVTDGQIYFEGGESQGSYGATALEITAHDGQEDNVALNGENIKFDAGDKDDYIELVNALVAWGGAGDDSIVNNGTVEYIYGDDGDDTIINNCVVSVGVFAGNGDDYVINNEGATIASASLGYDNDTFINNGTIELIFGGDGADTITNAANATVNYIDGGAGDDSIVNEGTVNVSGISAGDGDDEVINYGYITSTLGLDAGNDIVWNYGALGGISGDDGNDIITNAYGASVSISIYGNEGDDSIVNEGTVNKYIYGHAGDDSIVNEGTVNNYIEGGDGADTITNAANASVDRIFGDAGDDSIVNEGVAGMIYGGHSTDTFANDSLYVGANSSVGGYGADDVQGAIDNNKITGIENITIEGGKQMINIAAGETVTIEIDGKQYDVVNNETSETATLTYSLTSGQITFESDDALAITAHSGQEDNVFLKLSHNASSFVSGDGNDNIKITSLGFLNTGDGDDSVIIDGVIYEANLGSGNDAIENNGAIETIYGDDGDDTITIAYNSYIGDLYGGEGNDSIENNGTVGYIVGFAGADIIVNNGTMLSVDAGAGADYVINNEGATIASASLGYDNDTFINNGTIELIFGGEGDDSIVNEGTVNNYIDGGAGDDSIVNEGTVNYYISGGDGDDYINNQENAVIGIHLNGGAGDDSIVNEGTVNYYISGGDGDDYINNQENAVIGIHLNGGAGDDSIVNEGTVNNIYGRDGADTITNAANASVDRIYGDAGDDSITNIGVVETIINGGTHLVDGEDSLYVGANSSVGGYGADDVTDAVDSGVIDGIEKITIEGEKHVIVLDDQESATIEIDGKKYDVTNDNGGGYTRTLTYYLEDGQVVFEADEHLFVTAHSGQEDNVVIKGVIDFNSGDMDDMITVDAYEFNSYIVSAGSGNDTVIVNEGAGLNSINGDSGDDSIVNNGRVGDGILGDDGNDTIENNGMVVNGIIAGYGDDYIIVKEGVYASYIEGGAGNDSIVNEGTVNNIYGRDGADTITNAANATVNSIDGGDGDDSIVNNGTTGYLSAGYGDDTIINKDSGFISSTLGLDAGNDIVWNYGTMADVSSGEGTDTIYNYGNITGVVSGGDVHGNYDDSTADTLYVGANSSYGTTLGIDYIKLLEKSGTINLTTGETYTIEIDGLKYDVTNWDGPELGSLTYKLENGKLTFKSDNSLTISAHSGQSDNIIVDGAGITLDTGDLADRVEVLQAYTISTGDGNDTVTNNGYVGMGVYLGEGDDKVSDTNGFIEVYGEGGSDYIVINGDDSTVFGGDGGDTIYLNGDGNVANGEAGSDITYIGGNYNIADGGAGDYDKVSNQGNNTTYTGMSELIDKAGSYNIQTNYKFDEGSTFKLEFGMPISDINLDISSADNAIATLAQLDEMISDLASSRTNLAFQGELLNNNLEYNMTRLTNLSNSRSAIIDADTALEYNNLLERASAIEQLQLLQQQLQVTNANTILSLISSIAG